MKKKRSIMSEIVINNVRRERRMFTRFACENRNGTRRYPEREKDADRSNIRPAFFRDTDRIMHSQAYSRYIDKTQVFSLFENDHITHRVLHVQFVSKIGRVIGRSLRLNEDLIEAIALGHDLGHVPYGHDGEKVLNDICIENDIGCFTHGAQSVRFLHDIEGKGKGLNITLQVLDGILSHNGEMLTEKYKPNFEKNWKLFETEYKSCFRKENYYKSIFPMTLEGCVVRISDVIAYIGRDIEDAIVLKLISRKDIPENIIKVLGKNNRSIINTLVMDLIGNSYNKPYLKFSKSIYKAIVELKKFNYERIYFDERIKTETSKIENMFRSLFNWFHEDIKLKRKSSPIYKDFLNDIDSSYHSKTKTKIKVIDYIAGMTDHYFNNQFRRIYIPMSFGYNIKQKHK